MAEPLNLDLWQAPAGEGPLNLDLGATGEEISRVYGTLDAEAPTSQISLQARLTSQGNLIGRSLWQQAITQARLILVAQGEAVCPTDTLRGDLRWLWTGSLSTQPAGPGYAQGSATVDLNVYRDPMGLGSDTWRRQGQPVVPAATAIDWQHATRLTAKPATAWQQAADQQQQPGWHQAHLPRLRHAPSACHSEAPELGQGATFPHGDLARLRRTPALAHAEAMDLGRQSRLLFWDLLPRLRQLVSPSWQSCGVDITQLLADKAGRARVWHLALTSLYEEAIYPGPGRHDLPPTVTPAGPLSGWVELDFQALRQSGTDLEFVWVELADAAVIIPTRRVYLVSNSASIVRASDGLNIPASAVSLDVDCDSWAWQFSASLPRIVDAEALEGEQVIIEVNGHQWTCLVDGWKDNRAWNSQGATITGRSLTAELSATHQLAASYAEPEDRTMSQLAAQLLTSDWSLDWQAANWLVPGSSWSFDNQVAIAALQTLAEAAGAFIRPDQMARALTVLPRYGIKPWELAASQVDLYVPESIMVTKGRDRQIRTAGEGIWISAGQAAGITAPARPRESRPW